MEKFGMRVVLLAALLSAASAAAQDPVERGKTLFNSTRLGTNGKSCATCHAEGSKLKETASYDDGELVKVINHCIKEALAGKAPSAYSADMKALVAYIRAVAKP